MNVRMLRLRISSGLGIACLAMTLSGCVTYGNTHALITPVGVAGYHTFKPDHGKTPREINLPEQRTPDRIAAVNDQDEQVERRVVKRR